MTSRFAGDFGFFPRRQPPVRHAFERGDFGDARAGPILDAGCGAGDNANWLAARGHEVVGFDISEGALAEARRRSRDVFGAAIEDAGGSAEFVRASGLDLAGSAVARAAARQPGGFAVVLDSALLHCLDDASQRTYVGELAKVARGEAAVKEELVGKFLCGNRPLVWGVPTKLQNSLSRSNRRRFG